jgi:hypothetical protein
MQWVVDRCEEARRRLTLVQARLKSMAK